MQQVNVLITSTLRKAESVKQLGFLYSLLSKEGYKIEFVCSTEVYVLLKRVPKEQYKEIKRSISFLFNSLQVTIKPKPKKPDFL